MERIHQLKKQLKSTVEATKKHHQQKIHLKNRQEAQQDEIQTQIDEAVTKAREEMQHH